MAKLTWDGLGQRFFETGTDHGVLYLPDAEGKYTRGVSWNGLISVSENPSGAEAQPYYADNIKYLNLIGNEEFGATIEAYTYPDEFAECDGSREIAVGISAGQQARKPFGFSWRTLLGNDLQGIDYGYKIHLAYGAMAAPSQRSNQTVNENVEPITLSWEMTTTPVSIGTGFRPTAKLTINSKKVDPAKLAALESLLYGSASSEPRLPLPTEIADLVGVETTTSTTTTTTTVGG